MSVGVLLVTHPGIGSSILAAAQRVLRVMPLKVSVFEVPWDVDDREAYARRLNQELRELDQGQGVLALVDLYGASPFNMAVSQEPGRTVSRVSGLNLPMLLRVFNYAEKDLDGLVAVARDGGRNGVIGDG